MVHRGYLRGLLDKKYWIEYIKHIEYWWIVRKRNYSGYGKYGLRSSYGSPVLTERFRNFFDRPKGMKGLKMGLKRDRKRRYLTNSHDSVSFGCCWRQNVAKQLCWTNSNNVPPFCYPFVIVLRFELTLPQLINVSQAGSPYCFLLNFSFLRVRAYFVLENQENQVSKSVFCFAFVSTCCRSIYLQRLLSLSFPR